MNMEKLVELIQKEKSNYLISKKTGISASLIGDYEKGNKFPEFKNLIKLADYFNVTLDYIAGREKEKTYNIQSNRSVYGDIGHVEKIEQNQNDNLSNEMIKKFNQLTFENKVKIINMIARLSKQENQEKEIRIVASPTRAKVPEVSQESIEAVKKIMEEIEEE